MQLIAIDNPGGTMRAGLRLRGQGPPRTWVLWYGRAELGGLRHAPFAEPEAVLAWLSRYTHTASPSPTAC
jgi:hypothetical protein